MVSVLQELLSLYEAKAKVSAFKLKVPADCDATEDEIFGSEEGDDSFIQNQSIVTVEYVDLKGRTLYVYPMYASDNERDESAKLQRAFDQWCDNR